jgi:hypothetical protein
VHFTPLGARALALASTLWLLLLSSLRLLHACLRFVMRSVCARPAGPSPQEHELQADPGAQDAVGREQAAADGFVARSCCPSRQWKRAVPAAQQAPPTARFCT